MTESHPGDMTERNIDLTFGFTRAAIDNPDILKNIPDGSLVVFIPEDNPGLADENISAGIAAVRAGENVYFLHVTTDEPATAGNPV